MTALLLWTLAFGGAGLAAWRWGTDSRSSREWQWRCCG
jgi:hypothetical protein